MTTKARDRAARRIRRTYVLYDRSTGERFTTDYFYSAHTANYAAHHYARTCGRPIHYKEHHP